MKVKGKELGDKNLEDWLVEPDVLAVYKGDKNPYFTKYDNFKHELLKKHNETTKGAILADIQEKINAAQVTKEEEFALQKVMWLNDHGPRHIATVIERASDLLNHNGIKLNAREVYLLLNSIQIHDIGNFYGRTGHEKKILEVLKHDVRLAGFDDVERKYIIQVAQVHGGSVKTKSGSESNNTIISLKQGESKLGQYSIDLRFLAAILRFADEIADDKDRADSELLRDRKLPKGSEVFHAYSFCIDPVVVNHETQTIEIHMKVPLEFVKRKLGKGNKEVWLLDEIYERALKMHHERIYCSKFWRQRLSIEKIWYQIEFYRFPKENEYLSLEDFDVPDDITFILEDNHYPNAPTDIFEICEGLRYYDGTLKDGQGFFEKENLKD